MPPLPKTHGNLVFLIVLILGDLDLQPRFRGEILPPKDTVKGLLKLQMLLRHVELARRNTTKSRSVILVEN